MEQTSELFKALRAHLEKMAKANAVVGKPVSVGDRHAIPLCELSLAFGGGGGAAEGGKEQQKGLGGGAGGGAKAAPVAVLVIDNGKARLERVGS
jgi:uncharacterized spore protein YtfJ